MTTTVALPRAPGVRWKLDHVFGGAEAARAAAEGALSRCAAFAERYRGGVAGLDARALAECLEELASLDNALSRVSSYAHLREAIDAESQENRDLTTEVDRAMVEAGNHLRFFELEWAALPDASVETLLTDAMLERDRHYLLSQRRFAPHLRSEAEETMLAERHTAAVSAWQTLFGRVTSTLEVPFDGGEGAEPHTIDRLLSYMRGSSRDVRLSAQATLYEALGPHAATLAHCYDTLVGDRLAMDRLRSYDHPMAATHLRNEVPGAAIERMMLAVEGAYPLAQRWFRAKAVLLGLPKLHLADQYAPLGEGRAVHYPEARATIADAFGAFAPSVAHVATGIMDGGRLDAEPRVGKRGGAFCSPVAQDAPVYVLMNFNDRFTDVMTLAHELGHAMHFAFAADRQTALSAYTGLALAEVPSTFAETIALDHVLAHEADAATRRTLICEHIEGLFATIFRQTVLARYELRAYTARADGQTLTAERLGDIWIAENERYYGDSVDLPDGYRLGWSYIPHFISTRFYTYAYVFAALVALTLHARRRSLGDGFTEPYLEFLRAGGSAAPADLLRPLGVDLDDPAVWDSAIGELEALVVAAEAVATPSPTSSWTTSSTP